MTEHIVYKILTASEHEAFVRAGLFKGSPADVADGFIHFSTGPQVHGTLEKHFAGQSGLVLLAVDLGLLDPAAVRWEPSRGGQLSASVCRPAYWRGCGHHCRNPRCTGRVQLPL